MNPIIAGIRSGGQTGVDRAALDTARKYNIEICGWCPKGGWAEDCPEAPGILAEYPELKETPEVEPWQRTLWNMRDADAILTIVPEGSGASKGTDLGVQEGIRLGKPMLTVRSVDDVPEIVAWLRALAAERAEKLNDKAAPVQKGEKTMSNTVRRAEERDIPAIMELLEQVNRVHYDGRPDLFKLSTKYTEDELRAILDNDQTPVFVCTDSDDRVLGHGFCVLQRPENTRLLNDILTLYIDDICVDQAARGQHVGRMIYDQIIAYARQCGCYNVTLNVWSCNPGAMKFYERLGLVPYKIGMETVL